MDPTLTACRFDLAPRLVCLLPQAKVVCIRQRREANAKIIDIGAPERVKSGQTSQVEMLCLG